MPAIGEAARAVLEHSGVDVQVCYPGCCGMPQLELGDVADVAQKVRFGSRFGMIFALTG
jgi:glycerol-3-phosphate dehydrogenase subunit C